MKVLLLKDVHKLGRAGDVKKVADGYGRNYLLPHRFAALATPGMLKQAERIRQSADVERARLNTELGDVAAKLSDLKLNFPVKAGETGKLYGSISTVMIADSIEAETGAVINRNQIDTQPIKILGVHEVPVRLTIDLIPELTIVIHREGEPPESAYEIEDLQYPEEEAAGTFADLQAELEAEDAAAAAEDSAGEVAEVESVTIDESEAISEDIEPMDASEPSDSVADQGEEPPDGTTADPQEDN